MIKESLRITSAVDIILERIVPATGASVGAHHLRPGTNIGATARALHYNSDIFDDPECFRPERWLRAHNSPEKLQQMDRAFLAVSFALTHT